jgi:hypothetical protein
MQPMKSGKIDKSTDLAQGKNYIENRFYRINIPAKDTNSFEIIDKKSETAVIIGNKELPFTQLLRKLITEQQFIPIEHPASHITIIDERPVRLKLRIDRAEFILETVEIILWENLDRVDTRYTINLERIIPPETAEEYGIAFPFFLEKPQTEIELLGGYLRPEQNEIRIAEHNAYSIRRTVALSKNNQNITLASKNCRVVRLIESPTSSSVTLMANLVNNFPASWNRREENRGKLSFLFSFTLQNNQFNPAFSSRFGWELYSDPSIYRSLFSKNPLEKSFLYIENENVTLAALIPDPEEKRLIFVLQNVDPQKTVSSVVTSPFFKDKKAYLGDWKLRPYATNILTENRLTVQIEAGGIEIIVLNMEDKIKRN